MKKTVPRKKEIAETVRKDCRRKKPTLASLIVIRPIKKVIQPLSLLIHHRYSDEATRNLIASAITRLQGIALELERNYESKFVKAFRDLAETLMGFLADDDDMGVQLELFDADQFHVSDWKYSVYRYINKWIYFFHTTKGRFSNPYKRFGFCYTQFSLPLYFTRGARR